MAEVLLPTTVVGSYPQPDWLIDRAKLVAQGPVRLRAPDLWRVNEGFLEQAQDDATVLPSATRNARASISSLMVRPGARATRTG